MTRLLTAADAASRAGRSSSHVYEAAANGALVGKRVGKYWQFTDDDVANWIARGSPALATSTEPVVFVPPALFDVVLQALVDRHAVTSGVSPGELCDIIHGHGRYNAGQRHDVHQAFRNLERNKPPLAYVVTRGRYRATADGLAYTRPLQVSLIPAANAPRLHVCGPPGLLHVKMNRGPNRST